MISQCSLITNCLFQDGARIHTSNASFAFLAPIFGNRMLSDRAGQGGRPGRDWAPVSPDLTPCDFFLHGYLKVLPPGSNVHNLYLTIQEKLYRPMPANLAILEAQAEDVYDELNFQPRLLRRVVFAMKKRPQKCLRVGGGLFEGRKV